jgi:hypothetical protein
MQLSHVANPIKDKIVYALLGTFLTIVTYGASKSKNETTLFDRFVNICFGSEFPKYCCGIGSRDFGTLY